LLEAAAAEHVGGQAFPRAEPDLGNAAKHVRAGSGLSGLFDARLFLDVVHRHRKKTP
jgi:hypothetical protein